MKKRFLLLLLALLVLLAGENVSLAYDRQEHDSDLEYVLFGEREYKSSHPLDKNRIHAIENALYLCVDQFNGSGAEALEELLKFGVPDIPQSIDEFDFTSNYSHREHTHRGWNVEYNEKICWPVRQTLLRNTVKHIFFAYTETPMSLVPVLSDILYGNEYKEKCENLCILMYYTHVIGDHRDAETYKDLSYICPLTTRDSGNPGIIPDLIECCKILFKDQKETRIYQTFIQELEELETKSEKLTSSEGGVNTDEEFEEYHQIAESLLETLAQNISVMLEKEDYFQKVFSQ